MHDEKVKKQRFTWGKKKQGDRFCRHKQLL